VSAARKTHRGISDAASPLQDPLAQRRKQSSRVWADPGIANALTIDVEDYFQVEAFASTIDRRDWETLPRRVERNTERLLDILAGTEVRATFFVLGGSRRGTLG
jgi:hypothetical protein